MALGYLFILFVLIAIISILGIVFLYYSKKEKTKNILFYALNLWLILISYLNITSLPSNYLIQRTFGLLLGLSSIVSIFIKVKGKNKAQISYHMVSIAIIISIVYLFFF